MHAEYPTITCLVQTLRNNFTEQKQLVQNSLESVQGVRLIDCSPGLGSFGLVLKLEGSLDNLVKAIDELRSLSFIQHIATLLSPSQKIVPDEIGRNEVMEDAKTEIISYLQRIQGSIVNDMQDLRGRMNAVLDQSQHNLPSGTHKIGASHVREAIHQINAEYMIGRVDRLEERMRDLERSTSFTNGRRQEAREREAFDFQRTQTSLKKRHVAVLVMALILSIVSLILDVYMTFFV